MLPKLFVMLKRLPHQGKCIFESCSSGATNRAQQQQLPSNESPLSFLHRSMLIRVTKATLCILGPLRKLFFSYGPEVAKCG